MADEDLLPPEGEENIAAPAEDAQTEEQAPDPIAGLASELGWVPKDQFRGDPEKWRPADEFIRAGRDIQKSLSSQLRSVQDEVQRISRTSAQILEDRLSQERARWTEVHERAVEDGDKEAARQAAAKIHEVDARAKPSGPPPEVQDFLSRNRWMDTDPLARIRAGEISDRLAASGVTDVSQQLREVERAIRREFPEHFAAPAKQPPATQTSAARNAAPTNRAKGFADMPAESQKMALDYERRLGVKREDFAKSFWNEQGKVRK